MTDEYKKARDAAAEQYGINETSLCPGEHPALLKSLQQTNASRFSEGADWGYAYAIQSPEVQALVEALKFYADDSNYGWDGQPVVEHEKKDKAGNISFSCDTDNGGIARSALRKFTAIREANK